MNYRTLVQSESHMEKILDKSITVLMRIRIYDEREKYIGATYAKLNLTLGGNFR